MIVPATVSSEIVIRIDDLPPGQLDLLKGALTFRNEERDKNEKLRIFGWWDLPETIILWREEKRRGGEHVLCMPRGFAAQLVGGLASVGATVEWNDQRSIVPSAPGYFKPFLLRWYQAPFVADLMRSQQGIGHAPTSSGKTVSALALMALLQQRSLVIVGKAALLDQWRERAAQFLGLSLDLDDQNSVGMIGQDVWVERDLTICLRQTLASRQWQTDAIDWGSQYGLCIADECHAVGSAETLQEVMRALPCAYFFGLSATPARSETQGKIIGALVGPIVARIDNQALVDEGIVIEPVVRVVETGFEADFWPTHDSDKEGNCQKPGCTKKNKHSHKDNWEACLKLLLIDEARNAMIAEEIVSERGHVHLVFARRKAHLTAIREALVEAGWDGPIYDLTGKQNADGESQEISRAIKEGGFWELDKEHKKETKEVRFKRVADSPSGLREAVILSTVADEGVDIPPIDRVHVVYPLRQQLATIQLVGRGTRAAPGKRGCTIVDYHDAGCSVFDEQHRERMRTYRAQGLRLERQHDLVDITPLKKPGDSDEGWVDIGLTPVESQNLVGEGSAPEAESAANGESSASASIIDAHAPSPTEDRRPQIYSKREGADPYPPGCVLVARPTIWGNQFKVGEDGSQGECAEFYRQWLLSPEGKYIREQARLQLRGKDLLCWCRSPSDADPAPCHAVALMEVANSDETPEVIEWWSFPEHNAQWRRHRGCSEPFPWVSPLDDCPPPTPGEMGECVHCYQVRPVVAHPMQPERLVLITGSRDWADSRMIARYVRGLYREALEDDVWLVLMHGGARGADQLVNAPANRLGIEVRVVEPDWSTGNGAGFARNIEMLDKRPERVGAFSLGTSGTQHTIDQAKARGIPVDLHGHGGLVTA